jgi:hypothetical protein
MPNIPESNQLIRLPAEPTDEQIIGGIQCWLEFLHNDDYETAIKAISFSGDTPPESKRFGSNIETFFGEQLYSKPDAPSQEVLQRTEIYRTGIPEECKAVVGFFIPLMNGYGIWTTFHLYTEGDTSYFMFEIFHA